jgi:hypothetical protein
MSEPCDKRHCQRCGCHLSYLDDTCAILCGICRKAGTEITVKPEPPIRLWR